MKFFLIVSFLMTNAAVERPMYLFKNPSFETYNDCIYLGFVLINSQFIS